MRGRWAVTGSVVGVFFGFVNGDNFGQFLGSRDNVQVEGGVV